MPGRSRSPTADTALVVRAPDGTALPEADIVAAMAASDVVLIGEQHDHPVGLELAADLFAKLLAGPAGATAALALETFSREDQPAVDAFLRGDIDEATLCERAGLKRLSGGHARMMKTAQQARRPVIASNAPRRLVSMARREGLTALEALPPEDQALVTIPQTLSDGAYRAAFVEVMGGAHAGVDATTLEGFFRAQNVWDATMAASVVAAIQTGLRPVVLVVGSFHVDFAGGLRARVREDATKARVWTLSMVASEASSLAPEDRERADAVAYVGPFPPSSP